MTLNALASSDQRNAEVGPGRVPVVSKVPGWLRAPVVQIDTVAQGLDP